MDAKLDNYQDLKLKLDGLVPPGHGFHRNLLFDALYSSLPRDPQVKVQIYNAEIVPGGFTNWHCHNGAAFFVALQGQFEAHFQEGVLVKAKAGDLFRTPNSPPGQTTTFFFVFFPFPPPTPRTSGQSGSLPCITQGSLSAASRHSRQAGSAITASI